MAHLIDKDALVAEIEKLENIYKEYPTRNYYEDGLQDGRLIGYKDVLYKIDTLEVKEVDLEKELDSMITPELKLHKALPSLFDVAKHFFELGLHSTITEEDVKLIWTIGDDIPYMAEEDFYKELLKRYKTQKGE